jgi:hypothetical protein
LAIVIFAFRQQALARFSEHTELQEDSWPIRLEMSSLPPRVLEESRLLLTVSGPDAAAIQAGDTAVRISVPSMLCGEFGNALRPIGNGVYEGICGSPPSQHDSLGLYTSVRNNGMIGN